LAEAGDHKAQLQQSVEIDRGQRHRAPPLLASSSCASAPPARTHSTTSDGTRKSSDTHGIWIFPLAATSSSTIFPLKVGGSPTPRGRTPRGIVLRRSGNRARQFAAPTTIKNVSSITQRL